MLESPQSGARKPVLQADDSAAALASRALSILTLLGVQEAANLAPAFVDSLPDAALNPEIDSFKPILDDLHAAQITDQQIFDLYLPVVARKLGEEWSADNKSFSEVTIGVAKVQRLLHDLGPEWRGDTVRQFDAPTVLVLTVSKADHAFGARIILGQLRRHGLSVRLALGLRPNQVKSLLDTSQFDAVMISASLSEAFGPLRALVDAIRNSAKPVPLIVLGGSVCMQAADVKAMTGADYVTCSIEEAIRLCALDTLSPKYAQPVKKR